MTGFLVKLYINGMTAVIACLMLRVYWFVLPRRQRSYGVKAVRFVNVVCLMALTMLLGGRLGGWAFHAALGIVCLMHWSERWRGYCERSI